MTFYEYEIIKLYEKKINLIQRQILNLFGISLGIVNKYISSLKKTV